MKDWRVEAARIWPELVETASARQTFTYGQLGSRVGIMHRNLRLPLDIIARHVLRVGLPPLTIVIVNGETGRPGDGIVGTTPDHFHDELARVYAHRWSDEKNPFMYFAS